MKPSYEDLCKGLKVAEEALDKIHNHEIQALNRFSKMLQMTDSITQTKRTV